MNPEAAKARRLNSATLLVIVAWRSVASGGSAQLQSPTSSAQDNPGIAQDTSAGTKVITFDWTVTCRKEKRLCLAELGLPKRPTVVAAWF